ncbi:MAG TPA: DinB family protein [Pyrinomonadaceae bacterium]|nr:DinB family protein [Pyrinomonadaceae bacterium]
MTELERITDQLRRAFEGDAWHGPSVMEVLSDVTAQEATTRVFPGTHTIWELTLHIGAWENACLRRLQGERAELSDVEDWAPVTDTSESGWEQLKLTIQRGNRSLREAVSMIEERRLDEPIIPGMPSVYITIQGVVQHDLYHAGQIAILKKALKEGS